jgi:hypothetical protein
MTGTREWTMQLRGESVTILAVMTGGLEEVVDESMSKLSTILSCVGQFLRESGDQKRKTKNLP